MQEINELLKFVWSKLLEHLSNPAGANHGAIGVSTEVGSFYSTPQPPEDKEESRDLAHCHPELVRRYELVKADFMAQTGRQLFETCTWRSVEKQQKLYAQGRTTPGLIVTKLDGITKRSRHNVFPSEAVDVCVDTDPGPGKHPVWDESSYAPLGPLCIKHGLTWGGSWKSFKDFPHIELPAEAA